MIKNRENTGEVKQWEAKKEKLIKKNGEKYIKKVN